MTAIRMQKCPHTMLVYSATVSTVFLPPGVQMRIMDTWEVDGVS